MLNQRPRVLKEAFSGCLFKAEGVRHVIYSRWFSLVGFIQGFQTKTTVARGVAKAGNDHALRNLLFFRGL